MKDDGEAAIAREVEACETEELTAAERYLRRIPEYRKAYEESRKKI